VFRGRETTPKPQNPKSVMSKFIVRELIDKVLIQTHD
jgi:hypothetical protein